MIERDGLQAEAGFARRSLRDMCKVTDKKEGARGGTTGSPTVR